MTDPHEREQPWQTFKPGKRRRTAKGWVRLVAHWWLRGVLSLVVLSIPITALLLFIWCPSSRGLVSIGSIVVLTIMSLQINRDGGPDDEGSWEKEYDPDGSTSNDK